MMNRTNTRLLVLILAVGLTGCGDGSSPSPTAPSPATPQSVTRADYPNNGDYGLVGVTLFGVVFESTPVGPTPIADARVYCDACGAVGHTEVRTDANGYYSFNGDLASGGGIWLATLTTPVSFNKEGYGDPAGMQSAAGLRDVPINGDTRFDVELVRR
jgi:hypothetical protein